MPWSPPKLCSRYPACTKRTTNSGKCDDCRRMLARDYSARRRESGDNNGFYSSLAWRSLRAETIAEQPCCHWRYSDGRICGSTRFLQVDHIEPREPCKSNRQAHHDAGLTCDYCDRKENRQTLCKSHHSHKTGKETGFHA